MVNRINAMIGLAARSGNVVSGEFSTEKAIKNRKAYLVILASDASENTRKHFSDMCSYRNVPFSVYGTKMELAHAIGKEMRASLAVTDKGLAVSIQKLMECQGTCNKKIDEGKA